MIEDLKNIEYKVTKYHYFNNFWAHKITYGVKFQDLNEFMFTDIHDFSENLLGTIEVGIDVCGIE
ncbi:hypothetical protein NBO_339g0001 [Nosema bombycis CQ1]|uniref:Uncharacterized protein n=1 Tax=Nosema bombycis (strain CQ1 / CVCC 102059) TaxID=578461 RepID=R0MFK5_NOSB1|nr:hypothetical protein NBO_339g0001 [Nosema bombycis CQ1]|eukprot:EOB12890.1 hypothetical protein NBO_339g0001 [Nosema bombycis CQ1]